MQREISINDKTFLVSADKYPAFWRRVHRGVWEPETFEVFDKYIEKDTLVIDFGAWIGPTALYAAQLSALCLAFEPDEIAYSALEANLAMNKDADWADRLKIFKQGIHPSGEPIVISGHGEGGDSTTSSLFVNRNTRWTIETRRLQEVVAEYRGSYEKIFIKIDIEGGEYELLPDIADLMADPAITFFISIHPKFLRKSLKARHNSEPIWKSEYVDTVMKLFDALPWERGVLDTGGTALDKATTKEQIGNRQFSTDGIIIQ